MVNSSSGSETKTTTKDEWGSYRHLRQRQF